jgi:exodeoxyribonuclease V alpha subunit
MTQTSALMQITSFHDGPFGGGIIIGRDIGNGSEELLRSRTPMRVLPRKPITGEVWRVIGTLEDHAVRNPRTGKTESVRHIMATWAAPVAPQGAAIRRWIARHPDIKGVGEAYAERLWDAYGPSLYDILRNRDADALAAILDIPKAVAIIQAFGLMIDEVSALEDLDNLGLDGRTAHASLRLFGSEAGRKFRENPYLLTLLDPWAKVDSAALASGIMPTDERRLLAAVDMAAARAFRTTENNLGGHTVIRGAHLRRSVREMLGKNAATHADAAIQTALRAGLINEIAPKHYQARAPGHMEREIERCVLDRLERSRPGVDRVMVATVIGEVEREDGILLAPEQKEAVLTALSSGFSVITGGAGTGKSTLVKAIRRAHLRRGGGDYIQVALSGRAAKRLREATGANAMTIYRFIKDAELGKFSMTKGLLVVDEFSMVGTPDLWQLLTMSPPDFDVVLVGDSAQLPPIKAGNPASALIQAASIPKTTLRIAQRQAASTGIPDVAEAIREGSFPDLPTFDLAAAARPGVYLWNCPESDVPGAVIQAFEALVGVPARSKNPGLITRLHQMDVQILAMTRRGPAGAADLGDAIEHRWMASQEPVADWGFSVGSKLLWTQNSYDRPTGKLDSKGTEITVDIMNGALGVIRNAIDKHAMARFDDGTETMLSRNDLARVLRGWAITVHKAQGSAFKTVLIPVVCSRLLDRAMLYTAVTRARLTAVLIGEEAVMRRVVGAPPGAWQRLQALDIDRAARRAGLAHNELNGSVNPKGVVHDHQPF